MRVTIKTQDLKLGMYVMLPVSWFKHPFLKNEFILRSRDQIDKIIDHGITQIVIDTDKGEPDSSRQSAGSVNPAITPPKTWAPDKLIPPQLREAVHDKTLAPEKKSRIVYESSRVLVERLLEDPKSENILEAKKGISEIVDLILAEDATSRELLKLTSHDFYTYTHSVNVGFFSVMLAKAVFKGSDAHNMHELGAGFFLHDIGKVRIDPGIINKPGKLTDAEMATMKSHPYQGYLILKEANQLTEECMFIVMQHHERGRRHRLPPYAQGRPDPHLRTHLLYRRRV